jgi:hypothetical protein
MPVLETHKKEAKHLLRWRRDRNFPVGGRIRRLPRYRDLTDHESLALPVLAADTARAEGLIMAFIEARDVKVTPAPPRPGDPVR